MQMITTMNYNNVIHRCKLFGAIDRKRVSWFPVGRDKDNEIYGSTGTTGGRATVKDRSRPSPNIPNRACYANAQVQKLES